MIMKNKSLIIAVILSIVADDICGGGLREFQITYVEKGHWYELIKNELVYIKPSHQPSMAYSKRPEYLKDNEKALRRTLMEVLKSEKQNEQPSSDFLSKCYQQAFAIRAMKMLSLIAYFGVKVLDMDLHIHSDEKVYGLVKQGYDAITYYSDNHISYRFWNFDGPFEENQLTKNMEENPNFVHDLLWSVVNTTYLYLDIKFGTYNYNEVFGTLIPKEEQDFDIFYAFRDGRRQGGLLSNLEKIVNYTKQQFKFYVNMEFEPGYKNTYSQKKYKERVYFGPF